MAILKIERNKYIWHERHKRRNRFEDSSKSVNHSELVKHGMLLRHQGEMKVRRPHGSIIQREAEYNCRTHICTDGPQGDECEYLLRRI